MDELIGRERELARLDHAFERGARIVTLTGAPGVGKTRLATEYAARHAGRLCDLRDARDVDDLHAVVVREIGLPLPERADSSLAIGEALDRGAAPLLVLDNFEQLAVWGAATVGAWTARARSARFLITSRARLGVTGEVALEIEPLAVPAGDDAGDAARLFIACYEQARGGHPVTAGERRAVPALVRALDGLPLAIELAAVCGRSLAPHQIVAELARPLAFLRDPAPASDPRRALDRAIAWSWDLLGDHERVALAQCAVFRGGFDLAAARAVIALAGGGDALPALAALRDQSLLQVAPSDRDGGDMRYRLLVCVRDYAAAELARTGGEAAAAERHARHYIDRARGWLDAAVTGGAAEPSARLRQEAQNLTCAHEWASERADAAAAVTAALALAEAIAPDHAAVTRLLSRALERADAGEPGVLSLRGRAFAVLAASRRLIGDVDASWAACREADAAARATGDPGLTAEALLAEGALRRTGADLAGAAALFRRVLELPALPPHVHGRAHVELAGTLLVDGESTETRWHAAEARRIFSSVGDQALEARALYLVGASLQDACRLDDSRSHYLHALTIARAVGDVRLEATITSNLALIDQEEGRFEAAHDGYVRARELHAVAGDPMAAATTLWDHGTCFHLEDRARDAEDCYMAALDRFRAVGNRRFEAVVCAALGALAAADSASRCDDWLARADAALGDERDSFWLALRAYGAAAEVARARAALRSGDVAGGQALLASARRWQAEIAQRGLDRGGALPQDVRIAALGLARVLAGKAETAEPADPPADALVVDLPRRSFRRPGGVLVALATRAAPWQILCALVDQRLAQPGCATPVQTLFDSGWPGQRAKPDSAAARVHTALWTLRKLGLREVIVRADGGYLLDPGVRVVRRA